MKVKLLLLLIVLYACESQKVSENESYDRVTTTTYENKYDEDNNLLKVQSTTTSRMYEKDGSIIDLTDDECTDFYKYINNEEFIIERRSKVLGDLEIVKHFPKKEESLTLNAQRDTIYYTLREFYDNSKSKLVYVRYINNYNLQDEQNNYEEKNEYDENGNHVKMEQRYFDTNRKDITYLFYGISYDEAKKNTPCLNEDCNIICYMEKMSGDTLIRQEVKNGILDNIEKTIIKGNEKKKLRFDANMKLTDSFTELKEDGFDIHVHRSIQSNWTDSTYYKKGKEVKSVNITNMFKSLVIFTYDKQGNVVEMVEKVKDLDSQNGEDIINEMLQVLRENEKKKESKNAHK